MVRIERRQTWFGLLASATLLLGATPAAAPRAASATGAASNEAVEVPATPVPKCPTPLVRCAGDCNGNAEVTVDEIVTGVLVALGAAPLAQCVAMDRDGNRQVTIEELIGAVSSVLEGCPIESGAIYEVRVCSNERFRVLIRDAAAIELADRILAGREPQKIVTGELRCGNGNFNGSWSWHLDPATVAFTDAAIELCDGCPSFVEAELDYWLSTVRRYCPWSTEIVRRIR